MLDKIKNKKNISIYGSRVMGQLKKKNSSFFKGKHKKQSIGPYFMNIVLKQLFFFLFKKKVTDLLTGYKVYEKKFFKNNDIKTKGFETDHEISAKLVKQGYNIIEVPISYNPRTKAQGKKINFLDAIKAIYTIVRFYITK